MRKLKVDLGDLQDALDNEFPELHYFLDLETGAVALVSDERNRELETLYDELGEAAQKSECVRSAIEQRNVPDWQKEELRAADQVEAGFGTRYIRIEPLDPHADYEDMEEFISTVRDTRLRERLWRAISGRGAFRSFRDVLDDYPRERQRWFEFGDAQARQRALDWLAEENIEPILDEGK
jgi:hypothetical protein